MWNRVTTADIPAPDLEAPPLICAQNPSKTTTTVSDLRKTEEKRQSKSQQLKKVFQEYGAVGVSVHIGISLVSLGMFYMVVSR